MKTAKLWGAAALALAIVQTGAGAAYAQVLPPAPSAKNPTVAIGANGFEEAAPDMATINAGLQTNDPSSEEAMDKNNRDFAKVLAVIKKYNVPAKDLQTVGVTVGPKYNYTEKGEELDGYIASNSIIITMRDMSKVGDLIGDLAAAGANNIGGPEFALEDPEPLMDKAREKAFDNAQRRALAYARKAGFKSVRLLTINENAGDMAYAYAAEAAGAAAMDAASSMKLDTIAAAVEPGLVYQNVYASFLFEMVP